MSPRIRSVLSLCAAALAAATAVLPGTAAAADKAGAEDAAVEPTPAAVQRLLDERVPELLEEHNVPGAAVSVVAGGEQVYAGGYGEADVDEGTPVDADRTSFPMASVSKSFTAAAVLQLADRGEVDLHADVNAYLPEEARIPETYPGKPVTLHHLLTHSAGFESAVAGMAADSAEGMLELGEYVREYRPDRIYPPGRFIGYSNYGTSLAGLVVQRVSGVPFAEYVAENVFAPLGMRRSAFATPDEAADRFETPTLYYASLEEADALYVNQAPAGAGYATASDMSAFLLALLNGGEYQGARILSPEAADTMLSAQHSVHPRLAGAAYGTWDKAGAWPHAVGHGGDLDGAHTEWAVVPEADLGVYVAVNGDGTAQSPLEDVRALVVEEVLEEFTASADTTAAPTGQTASGVAPGHYEGSYRTTRIGRSDTSELMSAIDLTSVSAAGDGRLRTANTMLGEQVWTPVGDNRFRSEKGGELAFIEEDGEITGLAYGAVPTQNYERIAWHEHVYLHLAGAGAALLIMGTVLVWPSAALVRRLRGRGHDRARTRGSRTARALAAAAVVTCAGYTAFVVSALGDGAALTGMVFNGSPLLTVPLSVAGAVSVIVLAAAVGAWILRWWGVAGRIHYSLVAVAVLGFVAFGAHYGLTALPV
ncbi:serine hydrolase domain-containing protein [Streptomonospora litoralis]|uniref:D-alanyl-D-alanine carboxypeptidase n=1 Tax=Streptomonospora litoralis TaxID=2498135 RepID=A0A4P6Q5K0_9ACTN|nr:serine hydrolase domain-containing protein [Streptomonospora litoralis]QBI56016.1 D-alanyl-D-alanine carboxypeptidase precursor [Streptomonospora litoralis]